MQKQIVLSRISVLVVLLALTRCIGEVFRMRYYTTIPVTYEGIKPFLLGAMVCCIAVLGMTVLSWYTKYRLIIMAGIVTVTCLFALKFLFLP